ncbi:MAG: hypothetical protein M0R37_14655 [Bacteroidales bacterium]|jgi:hypothetical protein|nr:hypothetical protein [Bacteroidales bacterium]
MTTAAILDKGGAAVASAVWAGDLYAGVLRIETAGADTTRATQIKDMIASRRDLGGVLFRSAGERASVRGWEGWEGCLGALRIVLPSLGLTLGAPTGIPDVGRTAHAEAAARRTSGMLD